jgi:hypothetical protein
MIRPYSCPASDESDKRRQRLGAPPCHSCHASSPLRSDVLSPRMVCVIQALAEGRRRLDERIDHLSRAPGNGDKFN